MQAELVIRQDRATDRRVVIQGNALLIGRNDDNDVVLDDARVSRYHARVAWTGSGFQIEDLGSRNGTSVNGVRISDKTLLRDSALIRIGGVSLVFEVQGLRTVVAKEHQLPDGLTRREAEIFALLARGKSNQVIAGDLVLSVRTVERHVSNIYAKVGAKNRSEATAYAISHRLL